jgi:hypothetical protein
VTQRRSRAKSFPELNPDVELSSNRGFLLQNFRQKNAFWTRLVEKRRQDRLAGYKTLATSCLGSPSETLAFGFEYALMIRTERLFSSNH